MNIQAAARVTGGHRQKGWDGASPDKAYDADWLREMVVQARRMGKHPAKIEPGKARSVFSPWLYKQRNLIERFFNKLKYYRT